MKLENYATLCPAYGRDYKSKAEVLKDFTEGKDFHYGNGGPYTSIRDVAVGNQVELRYKRLTMATMYKVTGKEPGLADAS